MAAMQVPQCAVGTDRSVWKTPSPRSRLANTISPADTACPGASDSAASVPGAQQLKLHPSRRATAW